jgi:hypothetical protein
LKGKGTLMAMGLRKQPHLLWFQKHDRLDHFLEKAVDQVTASLYPVVLRQKSITSAKPDQSTRFRTLLMKL